MSGPFYGVAGRSNLRTIYDKLHVHSRTEATAKYLGRD